MRYSSQARHFSFQVTTSDSCLISVGAEKIRPSSLSLRESEQGGSVEFATYCVIQIGNSMIS